jgi:succinate dehydrogenase / fumarate reductase cytochrome b subunit
MLSKLRFNTVVGKKIVMAITGLALCVFLVGHLAGNLLLLWGKDKFNAYAAFLTPLPILPIIQLGLIAILLLHVIDALVLVKGNYEARPVPYQSKKMGTFQKQKVEENLGFNFHDVVGDYHPDLHRFPRLAL